MLVSCQMEELLLRNTVECERMENVDVLRKLVNSTTSVLIETNVCVYCQQEFKQSFLAFRSVVKCMKLKRQFALVALISHILSVPTRTLVSVLV